MAYSKGKQRSDDPGSIVPVKQKKQKSKASVAHNEPDVSKLNLDSTTPANTTKDVIDASVQGHEQPHGSIENTPQQEQQEQESNNHYFAAYGVQESDALRDVWSRDEQSK